MVFARGKSERGRDTIKRRPNRSTEHAHRHRDGVDSRVLDEWQLCALELRVQECHVEPDVVPEHRQVADEYRDLPRDLPEPRRGDQVAISQPGELAHVIRYTSLR